MHESMNSRSSAAVWSTFSQSRDSAPHSYGIQTQYHILAVDVNATAGPVSIFAADMYPAPPSGVQFAVRDWHRQEECEAGADAVATRCVHLVGPDDVDGAAPLVALGDGITWPYGTHTIQLHTATALQPGKLALLGELDKFVPLSSKRFGDVRATQSRLTAVVTGKPGEVVHVTGLRQNGNTWLVVRADVLVGAGGTGEVKLE